MLDAEKLNVESASRVAGILAGTATDEAKAFALLDEGLVSRPQILGVTSPRTLGYFAHQARAADLAESLVAAPAMDAFEVASRASTLQAQALGVTVPAFTQTLPSVPSEALAGLASAKGVAATPAMLAAWSVLDGQPTSPAIARLVGAFTAFEVATRVEFADADQAKLATYMAPGTYEVDHEATRAADLPPAQDWNLLAAAGVDVGPILSARGELLRAAKDLADALAAHAPPVSTTCAPQQQSLDASTLLFSIDMHACGNVYSPTPAILMVDAGGDDVYHNNAGGNRLVEATGCNEFDGGALDLRPAAAAMSFDFGGNDVRDGPVCGANGGAALGAGVLVDVLGDDLHRTRGAEPFPNNVGNFANGAGVNGGGHAGLGLLIDTSGADRYEAGDYAVNGGSLIGLGILIDGGLAHDERNAGFGGTNGGANIGAGFLFDAGGDDLYRAEARASNGGALHGAAVLIDLGGADEYHSWEISMPRYAGGTNGGTVFGAGFLYDGGAGADLYKGLRDGVSGGGVDGLGTLVDIAGVSRHEASYNGTIGAGWSLLPGGHFSAATFVEGRDPAGGGFGTLIDMGGDDVYSGGMFATVGGAYIGASFFVDALGDDKYYARDGGGAMGGVGGHNAGLGVGFLFDGGGADEYWADVQPISPAGEPRPQEPVSGPGIFEFGGKGANGGACRPGAVGLLVDVRGDDTYIGNSSGINGGAAVLAAGMLIDGAGNDHYFGKDRGVNGGGYGASGTGGFADSTTPGPAFGFMIDIAGNDHYSAGTQDEVGDRGLLTPGHGVNGGGHFAWGFLYDGDGRDHRYANGKAANGGGVRGVGLLLDVARVTGSASDIYVQNRTSSTTATPLLSLGSNGGATIDHSCAGTVNCLEVAAGLLADLQGAADEYREGNGTMVLNQCIFPKGEIPHAVGQQRDVAVGTHMLNAPCAAI